MEMAEDRFESLDDYYRDGPFVRVVDERRAILPASARLFMLRPPPGSYPKPPTADFNLVLTIGSPHRVSLDLGAGRWRKLTVAGDMGLQPANAFADIVDDDDHQILIVSMPEGVVLRRLEELGSVVTDFGVLHAMTFTDVLVEQLCLRMWMESQEGGALGALFIDTAVTTIVTLLARLALKTEARAAGTGGLPPLTFRRVVEYIDANLAADLRLDELASAGGLSASHLVRAFRAETGMSPHRYVVRARIERAKELLVRTDTPIKGIAAACGFSSPGHLATWFRRVTGTTPSEFRRVF